HHSPQALAGTIIVELLVDDRRIHAGKRWNYGRCAHATLAMAGNTIHGDKGPTLRITGGNLVKRTASPSDPSGRAQSGYWFLRGCNVGPKAKSTANCAPDVERRFVLLITAKNAKAKDGGDDHDECHHSPGNRWPGVMKPERPLITDHQRAPALSAGPDTS